MTLQTQLRIGDVLILGAFICLWSVAITGCALFSKTSTTDQKLADVRNLAYAAASIGTREAILQNPIWRVRFEAAETQLDQLVTQRVVTGDLLRNVLAALPVKELKSQQAAIAIEQVTLLFDLTAGTKISIDDQSYALAAATGIRDGIKIALGK